MVLKTYKVVFFLFIFVGTRAWGLTESKTFKQLIDPNDATVGTFQQRYWINSDFAQGPNSPILYYLCNEVSCDADTVVFNSKKSFIPIMAKNLKARLVALEHRFYGTSAPFTTYTKEHLKYLNTENALADFARFQRSITKEKGWTGKWVAMGRSYSANLASYYRLKNPDLVVGALASSACPIFSQGNENNDITAAKAAGVECVKKYREKIITPLIASLNRPSQLAPYQEAFHIKEIDDPMDVLATITGIVLFEIQMEGGQKFCNAINSQNPLRNVGNVAVEVLRKIRTSPLAWSYMGAKSESAKDYEKGFGTRQWLYQSCTQWGIYIAAVNKANPETKLSILSVLTDELPMKYCKDYFSIDALPPVEKMNDLYYKPLLNPLTSKILFMNGGADPACFPYSISIENGNATNPNTIAYTIPGGAHCQDFDPPQAADSAELKKARDFELTVLRKWLQ